jgi:protein-disulfide isomerase
MSEHTSRGINPALYTPIAIVVAGLFIGGGLMYGLKGTSAGTGTATGGAPAKAVNIKDVKTDGSPYIGNANAKVVLAYWSDYQCPFCKAVEHGHEQIPIEPSFPTLIKEYVDTGKLKIVFKDYPFLSEDSDTAALYGRAVWEMYQSKYWEWREAMVEAQDEEHGGFGDEATILALSGKIAGIDAQALKAKVAEKGAAYAAAIAADRAEGASFGINGTPGFITGKTLLPGAVGIAEFKAAIDPQL